ncbi:putative retrotransposon hot spot (RHS) protein [Trypanosoma cruzi]|uniref:Retrotransposon hot spot (RHS) protein, putative n=2 Tax=Trypanosoma cruzi TaxID=5693 RepID=Q4DRP9_TRYCC|nr:retrotransposon hot spot (RHS) protein, putative [Trypanosoma cruzi]EAN95199.1 retrotransposon hot spot (RHS) protein, putative [Trypanosoma cruzi]PWV15092.1 putative retrotransposon hot spot (RHS) protein [Trypanosoma cruzi]RNC57687.1 putative retrotransposon hot spot (RHS) protein [Trypanosoma cruzi]|eukprot:XP_817050.1 retrotransposon hot spot (RHS) protein [Trypanosoma cruzi strain CL Brener]
MSGRPEEGLHNNEENQSSNVPQRDRRRARLESNSDTDQPAATRRRDEEMRQPQWTMGSTVEDILLEGSTNRTDMKLNDFLRSKLGGTAAVGEDYNVTMEAFVQDPETFIQNKRLLRIITALPSYQLLEIELERELYERKILLEAINKLHPADVFSLEQWRDYEGKNTITPFPKAKLNGVLTQVQRESREAEERLRREEEERRRRAQEMKFTISTTIEDVLFRGEFRYKEMMLNDFLLLRFGGRGVVATNRSVLLEEFFKEPTRYIRDKRVLGEIRATDRYLRMERAVREETDMEEDIKKLHYNHVSTLLGWLVAAPEVKEIVHRITESFLDAALEEARNSMRMSAAMKLEGLYESVCNARWSHLVEVPGGEGTGLEVREGEPPQSWTYKAVGRTLEKDDGVQQSGAASPRLMVLTSDKGWPYTWNRKGVESTRDCYVNCEVDRVWQIVKGDLTEWFSSHGEADFGPRRRVLIGTPGIGKSMAAGSYLLYQLLHYDAEQLPMVVYFIADRKFLFDKTSRTVSTYMGESSNKSFVRSLSDRGMKGYIIYDVAEPDDEPSSDLPSRGWGMVLVSPPFERNYKQWVKRSGATEIVMNCPGESDVKAVCIWMRRHRPVREQAEYWHVVKGQMDEVGPIPRYIFDERKYDNWVQRCHKTVDEATSSVILQYTGLGCGGYWDRMKVLYWLARVVRVRGGEFGSEFFFNLPVSAHLGNKTLFKSAKLMQQHYFNLLISWLTDYLISENFGRCTVFAFLNGSFVSAIERRLRELRPSPQRQSHRCALAVYSQERSTRHHVLSPLERFSERIDVECGVLYVTEVENFPLVDGFFFVKLNPMTLVGLRMAAAGGHHTTASTARQFTECLAAYFNGWDELSRDMSWEIIYVQHADSTPMNDWQRCDVVDSNNVSEDEKKIAAFWNEKVRQYQVSISSEDAPRRH